MQVVLEQLKASAARVNDEAQKIIDQFGRLPPDALALRGTHGLSVSDILTRATSIADAALTISDLPEERLHFVSTARLINYGDYGRHLADSLHRFGENLAAIDSWGGADRVDPSGVIYTRSGNNVNVRSFLDELTSIEDNALDAHFIISSAGQPRGIGTFAAASRTLTERSAEASSLVAEIRTDAEALRSEIAELTARAQRATRAEGEVQRLLQEVEKARRTAEENEQKINAATASAEAARGAAASLEAQVTDYAARFDAFKASIDAREAALAEGNKRLTDLSGRLQTKEGEVSGLVERAQEMLGGATIAGLSSTYKTQADAVDEQLKWARWGFYSSIALLVLSVLVALNLLRIPGFISPLPPIPNLTVGTTAGTLAVQTLAALGSRALVILPTLLLAGFAAHRHSALFRLREEYSHKAAIAASVHGFKTQAPSFQEPIAAAVFQELLQNPAGTMDGEKKTARNGFMSRLIAPHVESSIRKMLELRDGAAPT